VEPRRDRATRGNDRSRPLQTHELTIDRSTSISSLCYYSTCALPRLVLGSILLLHSMLSSSSPRDSRRRDSQASHLPKLTDARWSSTSTGAPRSRRSSPK